MWWGRGDTSRLSEEEKTTLAHLRRLDETGHIRSLDPERSDLALRGIIFFGQWESVLRAMTALRNVLLLFGALIGIWIAFKGEIITWVGGLPQ